MSFDANTEAVDLRPTSWNQAFSPSSLEFTLGCPVAVLEPSFEILDRLPPPDVDLLRLDVSHVRREAIRGRS